MQTAQVTINNVGKQKLLSVKVHHIYSDVYSNELAWEAGDATIGITSFKAQSVQYNTGALTTGRDWWLVTWYDAAGDCYFTDPLNFRNIIDVVESISTANCTSSRAARFFWAAWKNQVSETLKPNW